MPCTDGGMPVTIDRLLGFVKTARRNPRSDRAGLAMRQPRHVPPSIAVHIVGLRAVDTNNDDRRVRRVIRVRLLRGSIFHFPTQSCFLLET